MCCFIEKLGYSYYILIKKVVKVLRKHSTCFGFTKRTCMNDMLDVKQLLSVISHEKNLNVLLLPTRRKT